MRETAASRGLQWVGPLVAWLLILFGVAAVTWLGTASPSELQSIAALALAAAMLLTLAFGRSAWGAIPLYCGWSRELPSYSWRSCSSLASPIS